MLAFCLTIEPKSLQLAPYLQHFPLLQTGRDKTQTCTYQDTTYSVSHSCRQAETRHRHAHMQASMSLFYNFQICCAGPLYNNEGVLLHIGATIIWSDGRRANFQCGFDQALTQYLEVSMHTAHARCCSMTARSLPDYSLAQSGTSTGTVWCSLALIMSPISTFKP